MNLGMEDETLEFKKSTGELKEALISICAMLNKHGRGTLYFGVYPNGEVNGQGVTESTLRDISRKIYESITPTITPIIRRVMFNDKAVIEVEFNGEEKPYSCNGIFYIRSADEDRKIPYNDLRKLFEYNNESSWDKKLTNYTFKDIKLDSFDKFYRKATKCGRLKDIGNNPEMVLKRLGLIKDNYLTNACYYLFSSLNPIVLKMAVFATDERYTFLDIRRIKGNIIDLMDEAEDYIKEKIMWKAEIIDMSRVETPEIPLKSLREIICNSFAHARYNTATEHCIEIYPSKISIYNPGTFPIGYTPEDFVKEDLHSVIRNPLILDTLYLSEDVEAFGSGFKNVYAECKKNHVGIDYIMGSLGFSFIFLRHNYFRRNKLNSREEVLKEEEKIILSFLKNQPKSSIGVLSNKMEKSSRTIQRMLNKLKEMGYIRRVGNTRGYWEVTNN